MQRLPPQMCHCRAQVGVVTRHEGFRMLSEPEFLGSAMFAPDPHPLNRALYDINIPVASQDGMCRHRVRDQEPLCFGTSMVAQPIQLHLVLNAFGGHREPDTARQGQDGRVNGCIDLIGS